MPMRLATSARKTQAHARSAWAGRHLGGMVMTQTPLRISFAGGGTDLPDFYDVETGAVLSATVDKYVYVTVKRHGELFNEPIRLNYSRTEQVNTIDEIENNIARECLRFLTVEPPIYISAVGDLPASSGMGGSSSFAVGLLNALHALRGERVTAGQLAHEACHIEMEVLKEPIGKQDQYAAAFGGLNLLRFESGGKVSVEPQQVMNGAVMSLFQNIMMFWTGHQRPASMVLKEQKANTITKLNVLRRMRDDALAIRALFADTVVDVERLGRALHTGWQRKCQLGSAISNSQIDGWYERAMAAGAEGGKICGAGGGGFLMFLVKPAHRSSVRRALSDLDLVSLGYEVQGSRVLFASPEGYGSGLYPTPHAYQNSHALPG
jgi:D-glycero-alpha-D-manno-heptose-7-phosphate kinase